MEHETGYNAKSKEKLLPHLKNGAKKVIVSAPCKNADKTIVYGVNENTLKKIYYHIKYHNLLFSMIILYIFYK